MTAFYILGVILVACAAIAAWDVTCIADELRRIREIMNSVTTERGK